MSMLLTSRWTGAAHLEAARTRTTEIDVDHLYLGLLAVGGQAARIRTPRRLAHLGPPPRTRGTDRRPGHPRVAGDR